MATIRLKASGKYELDIRIKGERKRISFDTKREAEDAKRVFLIGAPSVFDDESELDPRTLKDAINFYRKTISSSKKSEKYEVKYFERLYKFLRMKGAVMVHDVTVMMLEEFKAERLKDWKASTVNREFNTYRHFFGKCLQWKAIKTDPTKSISTLPEAKNPRRVWTDEEFASVCEFVPEWARIVLIAMNWIGAGPAELSRVTWSDVDFDRSTILLKRYKGSGEERRRSVPMPAAFLEFMKKRREIARRRFVGRPEDLAFLNSKDHPIDARQLATLVRRAVRFNSLPDGTVPYGVRHKFATELLEANVGEDHVRRLMGHASVRTLIENYSHIKSESLKDAMEVRATQAANVTALKKDNEGRGR